MQKSGVLKKRLPIFEAERVGFEPTIPCGIPAFQAGALGQLRYLSVTLRLKRHYYTKRLQKSPSFSPVFRMHNREKPAG